MTDQILISSRDLFKLSLEKTNIESSYNPIIIEDSLDPIYKIRASSQDRISSEPHILETNQIIATKRVAQNDENSNNQVQKLDLTFNQFADNRIQNQSPSQQSQQIEPQEPFFFSNYNSNIVQQNSEVKVEEIQSSQNHQKILQPKSQNLNLQLTDTFSRYFNQTQKSNENYIENALSPQEQRFNQFINVNIYLKMKYSNTLFLTQKIENCSKIDSRLNKNDCDRFSKQGKENQILLKQQNLTQSQEKNAHNSSKKHYLLKEKQEVIENYNSQQSILNLERFQTQNSSILKNCSSQENITKNIQNSASQETRVAYELLQKTLFSQKSKSKTSRGVFSPQKQSLDQQYMELLRRPSTQSSNNQNNSSSCFSNNNYSQKQNNLNNFSSTIRIEKNEINSQQNFNVFSNNTNQYYLSQNPSNQTLSAKIDRLAYEHFVLQENKQRLRDKQFKCEMKECTFKPNLLTSRSNSKLLDANVQITQSFYPKEQLQEFIKKQDAIQKKYEQSQRFMKEQQDQKIQSTIKSKPTLSKRSQILAKEVNKENQNVVDRLYESSLYQSQRTTPIKQTPTPSKQRKTPQNLRDKSKENSNQEQNFSKESQFFFQPSISERAHNIIRNQRVDVLLYEDAQRRQKYQEEQKTRSTSKSSQCGNSVYQVQPNLFTTKIQAQSQNNLILGFIKEFESSFKSNQDENLAGQESPKTLLFVEMIQILKILRFITISTYETNKQYTDICIQIWNFLKGDLKGYILKRNLQLFLLAVMNIFDKKCLIPKLNTESISNVLQNHIKNQKQVSDIKIIEDFQTSQNSVFSNLSETNSKSQYNLSSDSQSLNKTNRFQSLKQETTFDEIGNLTLSQEDVYNIHQKYQILYNNRLSIKKPSNIQDQQQMNLNSNENQNRSKSPKLISQNSEYLAQKKRQKLIQEIVQKEPQTKKIDLASLLSYQQEKTNIEIQQLRQKNIQEELSNCTFKPQLIQSPLVKQFL
ncbi:hypothetical protein ABPG74_013601 [Tetrahymena malaccensis]